jgi:hypothetical protein
MRAAVSVMKFVVVVTATGRSEIGTEEAVPDEVQA